LTGGSSYILNSVIYICEWSGMYNFHNRHYIFRQSDGQIRNFYCDSRQNLCCGILDRNSFWSDATVIARNVHQYFYAELGQDNFYHILFQDNDGNISYSKTDGQYVKTFPVLNSKTPAVYNKHLYVAPLDDEIYLFYVLQHDNSFLLAYQMLKNNKPGTPKIVDYVSGSSIPCSVLYDSDLNIYAFYQSYDGKYLQLGYKKFSTVRKHWSDFTAITKYQGNCEYPHAIMDPSGTIHLCYQRRAPKLFELVCQQKAPDRNLWSAETVLHSSVHPFENASIVQVNDKIIVYWVRNDIIYYCAGSLSGENWTRPARYGTQPGRRLQCVCWKDLWTGDGSSNYRTGDSSANYRGTGTSFRHGDSSAFRGISSGRDGSAFGDVSSGRDSSVFGDVSSGRDSSALSPGIYPGVVSDGFSLVFMDTGSITGGKPFQRSPSSAASGGDASGNELKSLVLGVFKEMQDKISEMDAELSELKKEMPKLKNAYMELAKEAQKLSIRLNMLENRLAQINNRRPESPGIRPEPPGVRLESPGRRPESIGSMPESPSVRPQPAKHVSSEDDPGSTNKAMAAFWKDNASPGKEPAPDAVNEAANPVSPGTSPDNASARRPKPSLDAETLKIWEEWQEPREWSEGG
jgi:hypothetical protein